MSSDEIIKIISNPAVSALLGAILGSTATFAVGSLIEYFKNRRFRTHIRKLIKTELSYYRDFLEDILNKSMSHPTKEEFVCVPYHSELEARMNEIMTDPFNNNRLSPQNYPKLQIETKALALDEKNLIDVEEAYYQISIFRLVSGETINGLGYSLFYKSQIQKLIDKIKTTEEKL